MSYWTLTFLAAILALAPGCRSSHAPPHAARPSLAELRAAGLAPPQIHSALTAACMPPVGWNPKPLEQSRRHAALVWISPTGQTAYGVIRFNLPLPVPASWTVDPFLDEMKKNEGAATLVSPVTEDKDAGGVRFIAQSPRYRLRVLIRCWGFKGWATYAGTYVNGPEVADEIRLAELARDNTFVPPTTPEDLRIEVIGSGSTHTQDKTTQAN